MQHLFDFNYHPRLYFHIIFYFKFSFQCFSQHLVLAWTRGKKPIADLKLYEEHKYLWQYHQSHTVCVNGLTFMKWNYHENLFTWNKSCISIEKCILYGYLDFIFKLHLLMIHQNNNATLQLSLIKCDNFPRLLSIFINKSISQLRQNQYIYQYWFVFEIITFDSEEKEIFSLAEP